MRILVTAGPTREFLDPVRFLSNRSSGKMGYAVARCACRRGHETVLISGPVVLAPPAGVKLVPVVSAAEMLDAVLAHLDWCEALIMTAAVADWRPRHYSATKLKKSATGGTLELERTADILGQIRPRKGARFVVGFAAETGAVAEEARRKLVEKGLDLIVGNNVSEADAGFEVDTNRVMLLARAGEPEWLPLLSKDAVAEHILLRIEGARLPGMAPLGPGAS